MISALRKVDSALISLYNLESTHPPEEFLVNQPAEGVLIGSAGRQGALLLEKSSVADDELGVGIFISKPVRETLETFEIWEAGKWTTAQLQAFHVLVEELSHFHYLIHHLHSRPGVSQLELEVQGDIDKFLLSHFAGSLGGFEEIFSALFEKFRLDPSLSSAERERYNDANQFASRFIRKYRKYLLPQNYEKGLRLLRRYYRLDSSEKISYIFA